MLRAQRILPDGATRSSGGVTQLEFVQMRSLLAEGVSDAFDRARSGALFGLAMAAIYVAYVLVLFLFRGPAPFDKLHTSLPSVVLTYIVLGPAAGAIVGFLLPLTSTRIGSTLVASIAAATVYFGIAIVASGSPLSWKSDNWILIATAGVTFGVILGNVFYKKPAAVVSAAVSNLRTVNPPHPRDQAH